MRLPITLPVIAGGARVGVKRLIAVTTLAAVALMCASAGIAIGARARPLSAASLAFPAGFTVTPHGAKVLYAERLTGRIRWLDLNTGAKTTFYDVPNVVSEGEQGLLGVALAPNYPSDRRVWAYATRTVAGFTHNQLLRIQADGSGFSVLRNLTTADGHNGGRITFGPDRRLYVVIGDNGNPQLAQDLNTQAGKLLRLNANGGIPADNPRAGSPVIAYGLRNSFGFAFDPKTDRIWQTDNGPECNDELNLIARLKLQNFGWGPSQTCSSPPPAPLNTNRDGPNPILPKRYFPSPPALTGAAFCSDCGLSSPRRLFFGDFNTGTIRRARLDSARTGIASVAPFYSHSDSVLSLETPSEGGPIYFSTPTNIFRLNP